MRISVFGTKSFVGKNLVENLKNIKTGKNRTRPELYISDIFEDELSDAEVVIILPDAGEFKGCEADKRYIYVTMSGTADNLKAVNQETLKKGDSGEVLVYSLPQIVGKWQESETGIAHMCSAVANDEPVDAGDEEKELEILFVDDFVNEMLDALEGKPHRCEGPAGEEGRCFCPGVIKTRVGCVMEHLRSFDRLNTTLIVPEIPAGSLAYKLYSMYLSFLPVRKMSYPVKMSVDNRGVFTELVKTVNNGQVSINIARPGNVRGQHWHNSKWEIFIVVSGHGLIQERRIGSEEVINFEVRGEEMRAVIMLPGYTHNIINLEDDRDLVTVMFANEQFDPTHPDTFFEIVDENSPYR